MGLIDVLRKILGWENSKGESQVHTRPQVSGGMIGKVSRAADDAWEKTKDVTENLSEKLGGVTENLVDKVKEKTAEVFDKVDDYVEPAFDKVKKGSSGYGLKLWGLLRTLFEKKTTSKNAGSNKNPAPQNEHASKLEINDSERQIE